MGLGWTYLDGGAVERRLAPVVPLAHLLHQSVLLRGSGLLAAGAVGGRRVERAQGGAGRAGDARAAV